MFTRACARPGRSFFLFGPRGTGKTTWLHAVLPDALWFDLLRIQTLLNLMRRPQSFRQQVEARPTGTWVVLDEVQRFPAVLNEVHALMTERGAAYRFAMSGSSSRKLRRMDVKAPHGASVRRGDPANLLAGRAINRQFFPLTGEEMNYDFELDHVLRFGALPLVRVDPAAAVDTLEAYVANYIREEIQQEAVVRNLDSFTRFLEVAALMNGQIINVAGLSRDAAVARPTVQGYFSALADTLVSFTLPAWRRRAKVKEVASPKVYLFDPGVARALAGRVREPLEGLERGFLLETLVLHELRAWMAIHNVGGQLHYWRTPSGSEVDFIWTRGRRAVAVEVKAASSWRSDFGAPLKALMAENVIQAGHGVYTGDVELKDGPLRVWPVKRFMKLAAAGDLFDERPGRP